MTYRLSYSARALAFLGASALFGAASAHADTISHGGQPERFKGEGDNIPPECVLSAPDAATEPFYVKWNCVDDNCEPSEIRTELWMYRREGGAGELVGTFLGFPANVLIDEKTLRSATVAEGLPVGFKLLARDRAGVSTVSQLITVAAQDNRLTGCTLTISTEAVPATGSTAAQPAKTVVVSNAQVETSVTDTQLTISTKEDTVAEPCEDIAEVCSADSKVRFSANITLSEDNTAANGTVSVTPGSLSNFVVDGSATVENLELSMLNVEGTAAVDGVDTTLSLSCDQ